MFYSAFKADPLNQAKGRSYRHHILEKGASQDEMKSLTEFLGRPPNMDAFYTDLGIPSDSQLPKTGYGTRYHDVNSQ